MPTLTLREGGDARLVQLAPEVADALGQSEALQVTRTERRDWFEVSPTTRVGTLRVGDLQIIIEPKIAISRLVFLMAYARNPNFWRSDHIALDPDESLPEALAEAFVHLATRALDQGLLKGYLTIDESLSVLRGRIREADQLRQRWGRMLPLEVRYDEFTVDIAENQILLAAVERLLRLHGVERLRPSLKRLRLQLADVTRLQGVLPSWAPSRLNARYVPALEVAELLLTGRSFEQRIGRVMLTGYLFNMATIFEDFVTVGLREAMRRYGGQSRLQYGSHLDEAEAVPIQPDYLWLDQKQPMIVADAKYKAEKPAGFPQADVYQMLAYCTALDLPVGHLVYARGNEEARTHIVRNAGVRIVAHALDLEAGPAQLLRDLDELARQMQSAAKRPLASVG